MEFSQLALPEPLMAGVRACGFVTCTPIQALTLPLSLAGRDVAGQAQTGTGKTAAFLIACFYRMLTSGKSAPPKPGRSQPRCLIIAPTRELAVQIESDAHAIGAFTGLNIAAVYGGVDYEKQRTLLTHGNVDVLIGTPGRLIDYFKQHTYSCQYVEALVIDEADRMFDMGFIADLRYMLRHLPPFDQRLSMLFSATLSYRAQELSYEYMNSPEILTIQSDTRTATEVTQRLYHVEATRKISLLVGLLREFLGEMPPPPPLQPHLKDEPLLPIHLEEGHPSDEEEDAPPPTPESIPGGRVMIFVNTKRMGEKLADWLPVNGIPCDCLSGDVPQTKRLKVLQRFQRGELPVLIATDVAGRGLHIEGVTHVINYDLPENAEDYVHRIGRTARAGAKGDAISLVDESGAYNLEAVEQYAGLKIPVAWPEDATFVTLVRPPYRPRDDEESDGRRPRRRDGSGPSRGGSGQRSGGRGRSDGRSGSGRPSSSRPAQTGMRREPHAGTETAAAVSPPGEAPASVAGPVVATDGTVPPARRRPRRRSPSPGAGGGQVQTGAPPSGGEDDGSAPAPTGEGGTPVAGAPRKRRRRRKPRGAGGENGAAPGSASSSGGASGE